MKFKEQPKKFIQSDNIIIGYINGKAIIENEWGNLFYVEIPEEFITIGETAIDEGLTSISELPQQEQEEIIAQIVTE